MKTRGGSSGGSEKSSDKSKQVLPKEVKGKPKSGRFWKEPKQRASTMVKSKSKPGVKAAEWRQTRRNVKEISNSIKESIQGDSVARREREEANKLRREENAKKSEVVQVIRNPSKLKRMKKKQLRKIEKRDTSKMETKRRLRSNSLPEGETAE